MPSSPSVIFCWRKYSLRNVINRSRIFVHPSMVKVVVTWERSKMMSEVRSFLGLVRYYWRFIEGFLKIALPMTLLNLERYPLLHGLKV